MPTNEPPRVAVIGCGYIGQAVGLALRDSGWHVYGTTTTPARTTELAAEGVDPVLLWARDAHAVADLVARVDAVYLTLAAGRRNADYRDVYLRAAENVVRALPASRVSRVIYTSSTAVYAQDDGAWVDEYSPTEPVTENARVLVQAEQVLLAANVPAGVSIVRLGGLYGPGREISGFAARFADQQRDDGDVYLNLVHLDDVVAALVGLMDIPHHGVLNLAADEPVTRRAVFDPLLASRGLPPVRWQSSPETGKGKRVCNRRIRELLNLELRHPRYVDGASA